MNPLWLEDILIALGERKLRRILRAGAKQLGIKLPPLRGVT